MDTDTRRSHAAYVLMLNCGPVSWKSRCKDSVSLSTSEAQYIAACEVGKEIKYLRALLRDVGSTQDHTTNVRVRTIWLVLSCILILCAVNLPDTLTCAFIFVGSSILLEL